MSATAEIPQKYLDRAGREIARLAMVQHVDGGPAMTVFHLDGGQVMCVWPSWWQRISSDQVELHHCAWFDPNNLRSLMK